MTVSYACGGLFKLMICDAIICGFTVRLHDC
jgi:hypothetical protein